MYKIVRADEIEWNQPAENSPGAFSKVLVDPGCAETKHLNFRLINYLPGSAATPHSHDEAENVFYVIQGRGLAILDGDRIPIQPGTLVFIPPKVEHAVINTGEQNLIMVFVASPPALFG